MQMLSGAKETDHLSPMFLVETLRPEDCSLQHLTDSTSVLTQALQGSGEARVARPKGARQ
jgi:hypothetical protein